MRPTTKKTKEGSSNGGYPRIEPSQNGYELLVDIRERISKRLSFDHGINHEDSRDLAGDLIARCCKKGLYWLCSKEERLSLSPATLTSDEGKILKRMLRSEFLFQKSTDWIRKQHAAMRDVRQTDSIDKTTEIDGEELPSIQISYNEPRMDINHIVEARGELAHVTRTTLPHLSNRKRELFEGALVNPSEGFNSANLALILEGQDDPGTRKRMASRAGEVRNEVRRVFRMKSDKPRPDFN